MDKNIFNKPLRTCSHKAGKFKQCPFADLKNTFEYCMLIDGEPAGRCTSTMRINYQKEGKEENELS